ncbi:MAG: bifunctional folylpolyglutamate synthase/dihydrofolate synthase [Lachnospirales bacterium]
MFYDKIELGLDNMKKACKIFNNPENNINAIHIAGTNGKGSVGELISANLISQGLKVGHFSSPKVLDDLDLWKINNENISVEDYNRLNELIDKKCSFLTQFERECLIAFLYFSENNCDYSIIETGMGGRLDATNVLDKKLVAVITPIDIDHKNFLGNTVYEIAGEKAGIIKNNKCVSAIQSKEAKKALDEISSDIIYCDEPKNIRFLENKTVFDYKNYKNIEISLLGKYQCYNAVLAIEALKSIGRFNLEGFKGAKWHCRFEKINNFILDGAHNPHGIKALEENIKIYLKNKKITFITAIFKDKDYKNIAQIGKYAYKIYTVKSSNPRCLSEEDWAEELRKYCKNVFAIGDIKKAVDISKNDEIVLVFGSLSLMAEVYKEVVNLV